MKGGDFIKPIKLITRLLGVILILCIFNISLAEETNKTLDMGFESQVIDEKDMSTQVPIGSTVTIDDANKYVQKKGAQLLIFLQNIAKPITLVMMVISCLMAIMSGLMGNKNEGSSRWILSAFISGICYTAIMAAPLLLDLLSSFMLS